MGGYSSSVRVFIDGKELPGAISATWSVDRTPWAREYHAPQKPSRRANRRRKGKMRAADRTYRVFLWKQSEREMEAYAWLLNKREKAQR